MLPEDGIALWTVTLGVNGHRASKHTALEANDVFKSCIVFLCVFLGGGGQKEAPHVSPAVFSGGVCLVFGAGLGPAASHADKR